MSLRVPPSPSEPIRLCFEAIATNISVSVPCLRHLDSQSPYVRVRLCVCPTLFLAFTLTGCGAAAAAVAGLSQERLRRERVRHSGRVRPTRTVHRSD